MIVMAKQPKKTKSKTKSLPKSRKAAPPKSQKRSMAAKPQRNARAWEDKLAELKRRLLEISDLNAAGSVLSWDEATYMPAGGAVARGRQSATLRRIAHEQFVDPAIGSLIDVLEPQAERLSPESDDASL